MTIPAALLAAWREHGRLRPVYAEMTFTDRGLELGAGTLLAPARPDHFGRPRLMLTGGEERLLALLALAQERPVPPWVVEVIADAAHAWRRGESWAAALRLGYAGMAPLPPGEAAPLRLFVADALMAAGESPTAVVARLLDPRAA